MSERPRRGRRPRDPGQLPYRQRMGLAMMLSGARPAEIAQRLRVSVRTVYNWRSDRRFREALDRELADIGEMALAMLAAHAPAAAQTLIEGLGAEKWSDRLRAADMILERAGIKKKGEPRLTAVELPKVIEVTVMEPPDAPARGEPQQRGHVPDRLWEPFRRALAVAGGR